MKESYWKYEFRTRPVCANCGVASRSEEATPYCAYCGSYMANYLSRPCDCFIKEFGRTVCYGTKEREECSCNGLKSKCNFY